MATESESEIQLQINQSEFSKIGPSLLDEFDMNKLYDLSARGKHFPFKSMSKPNNQSKLLKQDEFGASSSQIVLNVHSPHLNVKEDKSNQSLDCSGRLSNLVRQMDDKYKD